MNIPGQLEKIGDDFFDTAPCFGTGAVLN